MTPDHPTDDQREAAARLVEQVTPFAAADAQLAASLFNSAGRRRGSLPDCMIAAVAIGAGAALMTTNPPLSRTLNDSGRWAFNWPEP